MLATICNLEYAFSPYRQLTLVVSSLVLFIYLFSPCVLRVGYLSRSQLPLSGLLILCLLPATYTYAYTYTYILLTTYPLHTIQSI